MSTTLLNVPAVSQLTTVTDEKGEISDNAQQDCVAASVDMLCRYILGTPENSIFDPDNFKDKAYSDAYVGGTAASAYVAYCKTLGVHLYSVDVASYQDLVTLVRSYIRDHNQPCLFTRDDPYVDQRVHPDWTHVCVFKGQDDAGLTAHDPYINQPVYKTDAGWIAVLREKQIWIAERIQQEENMQIDISNPDVARYYKPLNDSQWQCIQNGKVLQYGMLSAYKTWGNSALCGLTYLGLVLSNEYTVDAVKYPGVVVQFFERGVLIYDPKHLLDNPPGAGSVYAAHLYSGPGQDPRLATAYQQIQQLQAQLAAQPPSQADQQLQARISKAIADLQGQ